MNSDARGISGDGQVIVGEGRYLTNQTRSFQSPQSGPIQTMPMLITGPTSNSWALDANHDGSVVVGQSSDGTSHRPVKWTAAGIEQLASLTGSTAGQASGVSADGRVIVGYEIANGLSIGCRWTTDGVQDIGHLGPTQAGTWATKVSDDGNVIVGYSIFSSTTEEPFRWTAAGGMVGLGSLPGGGLSQALDTNADGLIIVGQGSSATQETAFVWTQSLGMVHLSQYLTMNGVTGFTGWRFISADAISADGTTIVGRASDPQLGITQGFVAVVPLPPNCGSADFNCDGDLGNDADIEAFFSCLAGTCPPYPCDGGADFNGDGDLGNDADIAAFFRVIASGHC